MQTFAEIAQLREQITVWRRAGHRIAFVPTMGNLHEGHLTLMRKARKHADVVVASIFVNPMQLDKTEDLTDYSRTIEQDIAKLQQQNMVDVVFTPTLESMYPAGFNNQTYIDVPALSNILEGELRPGHFRSVATMINKLFNIVQPDVACFGEKDYQQLALIRQMVIDLSMDIKIVGVPTVREMDGLAMSSCNSHLTVDERQRAPVLARTMRWVSSQMRGGRCDYDELIIDANDQLRAGGLEPDKSFIRDAVTLLPITEATQQAVILMSTQLGKARLIDNQVVDISTNTTTDEEVAEAN